MSHALDEKVGRQLGKKPAYLPFHPRIDPTLATSALPSLVSTRRFFTSGTASLVPVQICSFPFLGIFAGGQSSCQQRRLAEFVTILGDLKLVTSVWEALRKEGKSGSPGC